MFCLNRAGFKIYQQRKRKAKNEISRAEHVITSTVASQPYKLHSMLGKQKETANAYRKGVCSHDLCLRPDKNDQIEVLPADRSRRLCWQSIHGGWNIRGYCKYKVVYLGYCRYRWIGSWEPNSAGAQLCVAQLCVALLSRRRIEVTRGW